MSKKAELAALVGMAGVGLTIYTANRKDCTHTETVLRCVEVVRVYDGDTLTVNVPGVHPWMGKEIGVRVRGIDTPEMHGDQLCEQQKAMLAKLYTREFLEKGRVDLEDIGREKFGRILATVKVNGRSLAEDLIRRDLAYPYDGGTKGVRDWCR